MNAGGARTTNMEEQGCMSMGFGISRGRQARASSTFSDESMVTRHIGTDRAPAMGLPGLRKERRSGSRGSEVFWQAGHTSA